MVKLGSILVFKVFALHSASKDNVEFSPLLVEEWRAALPENCKGDLLFPGRSNIKQNFNFKMDFSDNFYSMGDVQDFNSVIGCMHSLCR